jgi:HAE1 family hydrophobic/amphiphilic exporter-1
MIPLSLELGAGAEIWSPLAKTVIGGLAFGVIFTLFITPTISVGFKQVINFIKEIWSAIFKNLFASKKQALES